MNLARKIGWVDRIPVSLWLAFVMVALTPVWIWSATRLLDPSDDPLGILALAALAMFIARDRNNFTHSPRVGWLIAATALMAAAILGGASLPALFRGVLAVLAVCAMLMAVRGTLQPMLALSGLALLALPILSSLQFFVGYPLRVITAEASRWLLMPFDVSVIRSGSTLEIAGNLVMVDAPCAGIHMAWVAYFTACATAAYLRVPDRRLIKRIPLVGLAVLVGNIFRNTLLVIKEAELVHWPSWTHEVIGLATFAGVCVFILWYVSRAVDKTRTVTWEFRLRNPHMPIVSGDTWSRLFVLTILCGLTLWPWLQPSRATEAAPVTTIEWPRDLNGHRLRPLALSAVEQRFANHFPGSIARFTDGTQNIVLRHVTKPTRMLHPATDCYRGVGYRVVSSSLELERDHIPGKEAKLWRCFVAEKDGRRLRVCERIVDVNGRAFTDASAWYWAAVTGGSNGPWRAITKAKTLYTP